MAVITVAADSSTITINSHVFRDFESGDEFTLTPVNPSTSHTNSSNEGVTIHERLDAGVHDLVLRVQKGSADDIKLNSFRNNKSEVLAGSVKELLVVDGADVVDTSELQAGSITTQPTKVRNNTDGNSLMEYTIRFRNVVRSI